MSEQIKPGQSVTMRSAFGDVDKIAVRVQGGIIEVTSQEEYRRARRERRDPLSVGYKVGDVVRIGGAAGV